MSEFQFISTPYGNFAAYLSEQDEEAPTKYSLSLTPIGELPSVPMSTTYDGHPCLDLDAIDAEGVRQHPEKVDHFFKPQPIYTVNRVAYTNHLRLEFGTYSRHYKPELVGTEYAVIYDHSGGVLTDSARQKLAEWMQAHRADILTPEFLARTAYDRARYAVSYAEREKVKAENALSDAEQALSDAFRQLTAASDALDALDK